MVLSLINNEKTIVSRGDPTFDGKQVGQTIAAVIGWHLILREPRPFVQTPQGSGPRKWLHGDVDQLRTIALKSCCLVETTDMNEHQSTIYMKRMTLDL